ncbi:hypothetical protein ABIF90_000160 [Bradyrhizobium japonicum]
MGTDILTTAFRSHTDGSVKFTRRMAIALADMGGTTPRQLVLRCERLGLLKPGSWGWLAVNGGITADQVEEVRASHAHYPLSSRSSRRTGCRATDGVPMIGGVRVKPEPDQDEEAEPADPTRHP